MKAAGATCATTLTPGQAQTRGLAWVVGAFAFCPCHLPITLWVAATLLSGTAAGALLRGHPYIAGVIVSLIWLGGTWRGVRYLLAVREEPRTTLDL